MMRIGVKIENRRAGDFVARFMDEKSDIPRLGRRIAGYVERHRRLERRDRLPHRARQPWPGRIDDKAGNRLYAGKG